MRIFVRDKQFYKSLIVTSTPIAFQQLITAGINMMDNIMVGGLGEIPMSGIALANQFINIFHICCMGLGMGAGVLTSRFWGMQAMDSLKKSVIMMYRMVLVLSILFSAITIVVPERIMGIFTNDQSVAKAGVMYFQIVVPCYILLGFSLTTSLVLRSVGNAVIPLLSSIFAFFINVFFNWVFIYGNLGAPRLEVQGAALGTLIARGFEFVFIMKYFLWKDTNIGLRLRSLFCTCKGLWREYVHISLPVLISDGILAIGNGAVAVVMGHIGSVFVAANAITTLVQQISTVVIQGISQASCVITGNTLGRGEEEKAQNQGITITVLAFVIGLFGAILILFLSNYVIGLYNVTMETKEVAHELMKAVAIIVIFQCVNSVLTKGVLRGGGDTRFLMVADVLFLWCVSIPLGAFVGIHCNWSCFGIYLCLKIDNILKLLWCIYRLKSRKWIKNIKSAESSVRKEEYYEY